VPDAVRLPVARPKAVTAAAQAYTPDLWRAGGGLYQYRTWQTEAWNFRRTLGEFSQSIDWQSRAMSRIRLLCAEVVPGGDEPEPVDLAGPAAQAGMLMADFCGGGPGHSAFLKAIVPHLLVPGEGWLIAERDDPRLPLAACEWGVFSTECVQVRGDQFWVRVGEAQWRPLLPDALPMRIYEPDPQYPWLASSNAEAAVPIMRRIFLIDSRIVAMMVSRLAMNGLMLIPAEGTITVPAAYDEAPDPFVAYLIDIASKNVANPGQASAAIPIPVKFTADLIEKWKLFKADDPLDQSLLDERAAELGRLGDTLGIARERVSGGMGEQNHWGAAIASEEEVRILFSSLAETVCGGLTKAYLWPMLRSAGLSLIGPNGGRLIVWYDTSELTANVDKSDAAVKAYDRLEASGTALRRELGLDESDAPDPAELAVMVWKKLISDQTQGPNAVGHLVPQSPGVAGAPPVADGPGSGPPAAPGSQPVPGPSSPSLPSGEQPPAPGPGTQPPRPAAPPPGGIPTRTAAALALLDDPPGWPEFVPVKVSANGHR
jgi:hypothetical protein